MLPHPKAGAQHPFPLSTRSGETAELAAVWMGPISAKANPKLGEQSKQEPHAMLRPGTLGGRSGSQGGCSDEDPQNQLCFPPHGGRRALHSHSAQQRGSRRGERGNSQLSAENFKSRSKCNAIRLNSSPTGKEQGWKQPFDSGKFALILLAWGEW